MNYSVLPVVGFYKVSEIWISYSSSPLTTILV
nr:MAG TPA: hypothetical protein [Crassvirales sp.]